MKLQKANFLAAAFSCVGMLISPAAMATTPLATAPQVAPRDVVLQDGGLLVGQLVDAQGTVQAQTPVTLIKGEQVLAQGTTDAEGKFAVQNLNGGVYRIAAAGQTEVYRVWAPNTAPPVAQQGMTMVVGQDVVRGQYGGAPGPFTTMAQWAADHPLMVAGVVGAAIAIPIALDDDDDGPSSP